MSMAAAQKHASAIPTRPKILHLTFNYPDELSPHNTVAVKQLIQCAASFSDGFCVSLHDTFPQLKPYIRHYPNHAVIGCAGFPLYVALRPFLHRCLNLILGLDINIAQFRLIHAHRLTLEGYLARELHRHYGIPYCLSIRASDLQLLRLKPMLRETFFDVLNHATRIAVLAPWLHRAMFDVFKHRWCDRIEKKFLVLGNTVDGPLLFLPKSNGRYVMALKLNRSQLKRKNVLRTFKAIRQLRRDGTTLMLDVIGDGSGTAQTAMMIHRLGLDDQIKLIGHLPHEKMIDTLSAYKALLLCSYPETFGLVYLEALRAGIPIIHAKWTGVDGMFEGYPVGEAADARRVPSIMNALCAMEDNYPQRKQAVLALQQSRQLDAYVTANYTERLEKELYAPAT